LGAASVIEKELDSGFASHSQRLDS
jgi:hypothetical protein